MEPEDLGAAGEQSSHAASHAPDLSCSRDKGQDVAFRPVEKPGQPVGEPFLPAFSAGKRLVRRIDGKQFPRATEDGRRRLHPRLQEPAHSLGFQGGGHHEKRKVGPGAPDLQGKGKGQVRMDGALVKLVDDHEPDLRQKRLLLDHAGEKRLGEDLDPRFPAHPNGRSHPVAGSLPGLLPEDLGDARRNGNGSQAAGLQHEDLPPPHPRGIHEGGRDESGFPCSRLRHERKDAALIEERGYAGEKRRQGEIYARQVHTKAHPGSVRAGRRTINRGPWARRRAGEARGSSCGPCSSPGGRPVRHHGARPAR